jgi:MFS family permease
VVAAQIGERVGLVAGIRLACSLLVAGNLLCAITPVFAGLAIGRILPGLGLALGNTLGAVWARNAGGVRLLGIFGAAFQLGIAFALLLGSALSDLGVDWRVGFVISAALGAAAFFATPGGQDTPAAVGKHGAGFLTLAVRHARVYRLSLLFMAIYGVPLMLGAWLIQYLLDEGDLAKSLAGLLAFLLFGLSAVTRVYGARLQQRGAPHAVTAGVLGAAGIGLAALVVDPVATVALAGTVLLAVGFGIPYATGVLEAQQLYPEASSEPVALLTLLGLVPPIAGVPLIGRALDTGDGRLAFGILAGFVLLAAVANLRRTGIPLTAAGAAAD